MHIACHKNYSRCVRRGNSPFFVRHVKMSEIIFATNRLIMNSPEIVVKRSVSKADIDAYLKKFNISKPTCWPVPALYHDSYEEIACGAFINGSLVGVLLGRRIKLSFQIHLIHAIGESQESVKECLLVDFRKRAAQFNPKYI